jgi:transcriptional regulator with XRE-family HTH domain
MLPRKTAVSKTTAKDPYQQMRRKFIANRIRDALAEHRVPEVAKALGVSPSTVYDWCSGRFMPDVERLARLAELTHVSPVWLVVGLGNKKDRPGLISGYYIPLPGNVSRSPLAFEDEWLAELKDQAGLEPSEPLYVMMVPDESMSPTLRRGEFLLYRYHPRWEAGERGHNGIYVLSVPRSTGRPTSRDIVRRLQWSLDGTLNIICDNEAYSSETQVWSSKPGKRPMIQGPAIWRGGLLRS